MRNILRAVIAVFILLGFTTVQAQPGCPAVTTATNVTVPCGQTCVNLTASAFGGATTTSYAVNQITYAPPFSFSTGTPILVNRDDIWSSVIPLGFNFCFYGNTFSSAIIGSNGCISFNTANAGGTNNWSIPAGGAPFLGETDMRNSIMAPWHDLDPSNAGHIYYNVGGSAPCRYLEVSWDDCPMFGDPNSVSTTEYCTTPERQTQMAVIYETSNAIEVYIQTKVVPCNNNGNGYWNNGWAIEGIMNGTGTAATVVPGRNATIWPTTTPLTNDAWRFTPNGTPNYTIKWFQGVTQIGTGSPIQVCPAGPTTYTASATYTNCDNSTITVTSNVFVGLGSLTIADSIVQPTCHGSTNGAVYATYNSTSGIISYGWAPGGAGQTSLTGIGAGTYIFTASDSAGCVKSDTAVLVDPAALVVSVPNDTARSCSGSTNNGVLVATTTGGTPAYHYNWTGGSTTNPVTGLNVGNYSVTATDSHGCTGTASASVSVLTSPLTFAQPQITQVRCFGTNTGQIIDPLNGGTSPISYSWSVAGGHSDTLSNIGAGTYSVTATDANNCTASASFTITQPLSAVSVTVPNDTVTSCTGATNIGTLTATAAGGTAGYSYLWSNTATTATISNLTSGTYTVTVADASGCTVSASGNVVVKTSSLTVSGAVSNPICFGLKGQIIVTVGGAVPPITYNWSNGTHTTGGLTDTLSGVGGGTYNLTVTDANGCSATASFTVSQPTPLNVTVRNDTVTSCSGNTTSGTLTATSTGGSPGYTYLWTGSQTGNPVTGLSAGTYFVTSTDVSGCTAVGSGSVVVVANPVVFNTPQITSAGCSGAATGQIILNTSGGTAPITFTWSGGTTQNDTLRNLAGGTYAITATDVNGCSATVSYTVNQPSAIVFGTPTITNIGCTGGAGGSISVTATGGTGTITYLWSNSRTTSTITGLSAGGYIVTATDASGCTATATYTVTQAPPIAIGTANVDPVTCTGNGSISVTATGGTGTLTYSWTGGLSGNNLTNLAAGGYTLTVTDANQCSATAYYIVGHSSCGGCPAVNTNNNVAIPCSQTCTNLVATAFSAAQSTTYTVAPIAYNPPFPYDSGTAVLVAVDDQWSGVVTIPFNFCFFNIAYNQIVIGSNGEISFNPGNANGTENWSIPGPVPFVPATTERDQRNTIMAPWQDLDPTFHGSIYYNISGTAPCRKFEVSWYDSPMFGDSNSVDNNYCDSTDHQTQMIVLYETTNAIDIYIKNKDVVCNNSINDPTGAYWNGGLAIEGIVNSTMTQAFTVPGRNATQWTAHNDAWRFTPAGAPNFTIAWYQNGTQIGTGDTLHVCPSVPTTYSVFATYTNCDNSQVIVGDSVYVTPGGNLTVNIDSVHNILCNNDSSGAVYASYLDTTSTVTSFGWSPGGANLTSLVNIPAGTYIFTVTTSSGCSKSDTVVLVNPTQVTATVANDTFTSCSINNIGTLTAVGSGGTPGYTYVWSNGATTATISGLTPGNYSVTVTDSHGCTGSATAVVVKVPSNLALTTPQVVNPTCNSTGSITVGVTGGTAPLVYTWSPTEPNSGTLTGLAGGTYAVTITDAGGCSVTASFTLTTPVPVVIDSADLVNLTCNGSNNGSITVFASGGTAPLGYSWTGGNFGNTNAITGLAAGTYSVTVTDSVGCTASASYTISQPSAIAQDSLTIVDVTCFASGSISVVDTGGVAPLSYAWSGGQTTDSITNQPAGTYTLTVADASGCSITASYTIGTAPGGVVFGAPVIINTTCSGDSTGSITASATGGHGTITYVWSNAATTATISNLPAGTYTVTASDTTGCSASASYTVTQPNAVAFGVPVITNVLCNGGSSGSIAANANGGTGTITFLWSNGATGATATGLSVGNYCVTATDSVGCSASVCYNITEPTPISLDSSQLIPVTCTASGQITAFVSGGTPGYTYLWSNTQTSNPVSVTQAGSIGVTITDANGCSVTGSVIETAGAGAVTIDSADIVGTTCNGGNNGSITVFASTDSTGGPITFAWSTGATTATITGLSAGITYTITATDSAGCSVTASYTVPQPAAITFNAPVIVAPSCNGSTNGSITVSATGGTGTITYSWGAVAGATDTALAAGTYSVTATDSVGCTATASYTVTQPAVIAFANPVFDSIKCNGGTGGITVSNTGGTGSFTYVWSNQLTGASVTGLTAATYCVTATDSAGCSASACYTLTEPTLLVISNAVVTNATCSKTGSVVVTVNGGTPGYTYGWSGGNSATDSLGGLTGGPVTVTVTDAKGCTVTATYNVAPAVNTVIIDGAVVVNELCNGGSTGSVVVAAFGGVGSLTYHWGTNPSVTDSIKNVTAGTYSITVTDSLGCTATASYTVTQPSAITIDSVVTKQVTCTSQGSVEVFAHGGTGAYTYTWQGSAYTGDSLGGLAAGTYGVTITDANGCSITTSGTVTIAPNTINLSNTTITQPLCNGDANGSITVVPTGGAGGFTFLWSNQATTGTITGLTAGIYCVVVHDANGCQATACDTVGQPAVLAISNFITTNATCNVAGSAQVVATGGTTVYHYQWTGGSTTNPVTGLIGGAIVTVTVTDAHGCSVIGSDTLAPAFAPLTIVNPVVVNNNCYGGLAGSISISYTGGDPNAIATYLWSPGGATTASITGLAAGTYHVTVAEVAAGCQATDSFTISQPVPYVLTVTGKPLVCPGACDTVTVTVTPSAAFSYAWSNSATTQTSVYCNLTTVVIRAQVIITDNFGCHDTASTPIAAAAQIVETPNVTNTPCSPFGAGNVNITATGGAPGSLTYTYNPGNVSNTTGQFNQLSTGTYDYTVTDALGCSVADSFVILPQPPGDVYHSKADSADCFGFKDGSITVIEDSVQNGPFTYSINGGSFGSSNIFDSLGAGNYVVVVENKYGCTDTLLDTVGQPLLQTLSFNPDTVIGIANYANQLTPVIANFVNPVYSWTPSTGLNCTDCANPTATIATPTLYFLTVSDSANSKCAASDSVWVLLKGPLQMPDAFTPNGDGKNDLFGPVSHVYVVIKEFHIYNRWGQLVHNANTYWDGKFNGKEQPSGTYMYYIEGQYFDPITNTMQTGKEEGGVTLFR